MNVSWHRWINGTEAVWRGPCISGSDKMIEHDGGFGGAEQIWRSTLMLVQSDWLSVATFEKHLDTLFSNVDYRHKHTRALPSPTSDPDLSVKSLLKLKDSAASSQISSSPAVDSSWKSLTVSASKQNSL